MQTMGLILPMIQDRGKIIFQIERFNRVGGEYFVNSDIYAADWEYSFDFY
jgi:hypothetical protein